MDVVAVPPITRGAFVYRDVLLVDVGGEFKRHPRASPENIKQLLNAKEATKDQVGHWWEAQLIHYDLPPTKQKDTAKVRLHQALNQGKLKEQPPHLAVMEAQMKKDYAAVLRKAMKAKPDAAKRTKRGREAEEEPHAKRTKVSIRVGNVSIDVDQLDAASASSAAASKPHKTTKTTAARAGGSKKVTEKATFKAAVAKSSAGEKAASKPTVAKATATKSTAAKSTPAKSDKNSSSTQSKLRAQHSTPPLDVSSHDDPRNHAENVFQASSASRAPKAVKKESQTKKESKIKEEPDLPGTTLSINRPPEIKHEGYLFDPDAMDTRAEFSEREVSITGVYHIHCPQLAEQLAAEAEQFRLFLCVDTEHGILWGSFQLAMKSGTLKIDDISLSRPMTFGWRARDRSDGSLRFSRNCIGEMEFDGLSAVRGAFHGLFMGGDGNPETLVFHGKRRPGPLWSGKSAFRYQQDWDAFPKEAYGR